jgi:hypothetical protein
MAKNPDAVRLGKLGKGRTSPRKAKSSAANGRFGGRIPLGLSREEWQTFCAKCGARDPRQVAKELLLAYRE